MTNTTRVSTFAMHGSYVSNMLMIQGRMNAAQTQVNTEMKSQTYAGLGNTSFRLVNMETQRTEAEHYVDANIAIELRLNMMQSSMDAMKQTVQDFRSRLITYQQNNSGVPDQEATDDIQRWAWDAMEQMKDYLNTDVDGQYLYAGSKTQTKPVTLEAGGNTFTSLEEFQAYYTGADPAGTDPYMPAGVATDNFYPYTRDSHVSYYHGDNEELTYRVDSDREIQMGVTAIDPAFEKAMRAMGIIAQGTVGDSTAVGGLGNNLDRIEEAMWLLQDALNADPLARTSPTYGNTEGSSDFESIQRITGYNQTIVDNTTTQQKSYIAFLYTQCDDIEKVDMTEAIVRMQDEQRALEASYSTISMVKDLSLVNYL